MIFTKREGTVKGVHGQCLVIASKGKIHHVEIDLCRLIGERSELGDRMQKLIEIFAN